jgi:hypothetical protein
MALLFFHFLYGRWVLFPAAQNILDGDVISFGRNLFCRIAQKIEEKISSFLEKNIYKLAVFPS